MFKHISKKNNDEIKINRLFVWLEQINESAIVRLIWVLNNLINEQINEWANKWRRWTTDIFTK